MAYFINKSCTRCGACLDECPTQSISEDLPSYLIDADTCSDCMACIPVCPVDAIQRLLAEEERPQLEEEEESAEEDL